MGKLTARKVETAPAGKHADGDGLYLFVDRKGGRSWWFLFSWQGRRPEMAIGRFPDMALAEAREKAAEARKMVRSGVNPIEARRAGDTEAQKPTFGEVARELIDSKEAGWRNPKHRDQWRSSLATYAAALTDRPVDQIDTADILAVLKPIWTTKPETASRLRQRIEAVLDAAKAHGRRAGENPAAWRGHLSHLLAKPQKVQRGHFAAMPYDDVPEFMGALRAQDGMGARALEFAILTACRTGEVLGARWSEIDMEQKVWTIPQLRTKAAREHRVPLAGRAIAILETLAKGRACDIVFESPRGGRPLSHIAMQKVLERMEITDATVHGFRSSFRDWAGNETHFAREVAEAALAHVVGDKAEQAYRRSDALEKRRALMEAWANYIEPNTADNVVQFKKQAATQ